MRKIKATEIVSATDLLPPRNFVFRLQFNTPNPDPPRSFDLVVKSEALGVGGPSRYNAIAQIMAKFDQRTPSESLSRDEVHELDVATAAGKTTELMRKALQTPERFWVKIAYKQNIVDLVNEVRNFTEEQRQTIENVVKQLKDNKRAWVTLGEIVAADYFLGNGDRIIWDEGEVRLRNPGNLFFKINKKGMLKKTVALDNYDPYGTATHEVNLGDWCHSFAPFLRGGPLVSQLALGVVDSINQHAADAGVDAKLTSRESIFFREGFQQAVEALKKYVTDNGWKLPPGILARAAQLGWRIEKVKVKEDS